MKKKLFILIPLFSLMLNGCGTLVHHDLEDYISTLPYKDNFRMLVMGDIHLGNKDDLDRYFKLMDLTINDANPDLIMLNGDLYTFGDEFTMRSLFGFIDSHKIPWGITYGNHDEQCFFTADYMSNVASKDYQYSVFKYNANDDVYGYSNYCINLMDGDNVKFSIYAIDSNRYRYSPYIGYDYIHQDQIDWYSSLVAHNGGSAVKSFACYHIPVPEFSVAYDHALADDGEATFVEYKDARGGHGDKRENVSSPKENSGFFAKEAELGSTIGNICSHDHVNDYAVNYQGIQLIYSVDSTGRIYGDEDKRGGTVVTIKNGTEIGLSRCFHTFEELD